jgi:ankyrin repeat protein
MSRKSSLVASVLGCFGLVLLTVIQVRTADADRRLVQALKAQNTQSATALLKQKIDVNVPDTDGSTALHWAAHWNDAAMADLLIKAGAKVDVANDLKYTPLAEACTNGSAPIVDMLLKGGANANLAIATGETPIMICSRTGNPEAVKLLLAAGADANAKEPLVNQTALMWAVAEHHPEVVKVLMAAGADTKAKTRRGFTALHFAAREGDLDSAKLLLASGVDINIRSVVDAVPGAGRGGRGRGAAPTAASATPTPAPTSAAPGTAPAAPQAPAPPPAAAAGVDENSYNISEGSTPLLVATMKGQIPLALYFLDQGANPNDDGAGFTPLQWAAGVWEGEQSNPTYGFSDPMSGIPNRQEKVQLIKALLAKGADVNARMTRNPPGFAGGYKNSKVGATAAFNAAYALDMEVLNILKDAGADLTINTRENVSPLMAAVGVGRRLGYSDAKEDPAIEVAKFLMANGNTTKTISARGENVLHGVTYLGWNRLLQMMVDAGADVNLVSKTGTTPWLVATGQGDRQGGVNIFNDTAELLVKLGADPKLGKPCNAQGNCREQ